MQKVEGSNPFSRFEKTCICRSFSLRAAEAAPAVKRTLVGFWLNRALAQSIPLGTPLSDEEIMRWTILNQGRPAVADLVVGNGESYELAVGCEAPRVDAD
jgi:hypothetical protein